MVEKDYKRARETAIKELGGLLAAQQKTEQRILQLKGTIAALDALSGSSHNNPAELPGLTEAIRSLFKSRPLESILTARDVRRSLHEMGFDRSQYSNFLASIHVVLQRLAKRGEIEPVSRSKDEGGVGYKRNADDWLLELDRKPIRKIRIPPHSQEDNKD